MKPMRYVFAGLCVLILGAGLIACSSGSMNSTTTPPPAAQMGQVAVFGQDAPLAGVVTFQLTLTGLTASDGHTTTPLLTSPQTVDFARLTGLRTLLDLNSAPVGSYTSVTLTLANPVIGFLNVSSGNPTTINMLNGTLTTSSITVLMNPPLVITNSDLNGLRLDFDMRESLQLDLSGQITGTVVPTFDIRQVDPSKAEAEIDDLRGGVVSVNAASQSFVMQIPNGKQITVQLGPSTVTDTSDDLSKFNSNTIVQVSGGLNRTSMVLEADEVSVISQDHFFAEGLITGVQPPTSTDTQFNLFVREALPANPAFQPDTIAMFDATDSTKFLIYRLNLPLTQLLFNRQSLLTGQRVTVGGALGSSSLTLNRVVLHRQAVYGPWVVGSTMIQSGNTGTFQVNEKGIIGVILNGPLTVLTSSATNFEGLSGLGALSGTKPIPLDIVGLLLKDPSTGNAVLVANRVATP